jgi:hypothetical protein
MSGTYKPVAFDPYGSRRRRRGLPRWMWLLLTGTALGVSAVLFVQQRVLPPRLSAADSAELRGSLAEAERERDRLQLELTETRVRLERTLAEKLALDHELGGSRATIAALREDVAAVLAALPPDPRGGAVEIRAARFSIDAGRLVYDLMLSRDPPGKTPLRGVVQLVLAGEGPRGGQTSVALQPIAVSLGAYQSLRGSLPLPPDFRPSQTTVRVLDRPDGRQLGMRVMLVK